MHHLFTMHDTPSGINANRPIQRDLTKLTPQQKQTIIKDNSTGYLSIDEIAAKHNCTYAVTEYVINNC